MKELATKGVEELGQLKNRVSRLYGMGRISNEDFVDINNDIVALEEKLKAVKEVEDEE